MKAAAVQAQAEVDESGEGNLVLNGLAVTPGLAQACSGVWGVGSREEGEVWHGGPEWSLRGGLRRAGYLVLGC